jgi:hypothetical protein
LAINDRSEKKNKSIAFVSNTNVEEMQCEMETDESILDAIVLLGRQFNKVLKKMDKRPKPNVKNMSFDIKKNASSQRKAKIDENINQGKGIQCHECEGFGHIRSKCPTYLKKQKKGLSMS